MGKIAKNYTKAGGVEYLYSRDILVCVAGGDESRDMRYAVDKVVFTRGPGRTVIHNYEQFLACVKDQKVTRVTFMPKEDAIIELLCNTKLVCDLASALLQSPHTVAVFGFYQMPCRLDSGQRLYGWMVARLIAEFGKYKWAGKQLEIRHHPWMEPFLFEFIYEAVDRVDLDAYFLVENAPSTATLRGGSRTAAAAEASTALTVAAISDASAAAANASKAPSTTAAAAEEASTAMTAAAISEASAAADASKAPSTTAAAAEETSTALTAAAHITRASCEYITDALFEFMRICEEEGSPAVSEHITAELVRDLQASFRRVCACDAITTSRCGRCRVAPFCSRECQRKGWPQHKPWCNVWQRFT